MNLFESNRVDYVFGLARNRRLEEEISPALKAARVLSEKSQEAARLFCDFLWSRRDSWTRQRRVVGKAEWTPLGPNPRFIVTSLTAKRWQARALYEDPYCARGDMENRIKGMPT